MDWIGYVWCALIGVAVGAVLGRFIAGKGLFSFSGDILFGVTGAVIFGAGFRHLGYVPESGQAGALVMAAIGAVISVMLRRRLKSI